MRIKHVAFRKAVVIAKDLERTGITQGQAFRSPEWEGDAPCHLEMLREGIGFLIEAKTGGGKPVTIARLFPGEVEYIDVEPEDLKTALSTRKK